jgi:formylglycine-generating enzyme required for sulfatase activity
VTRDLSVPRPIDLPADVPTDGPLDSLDDAKTLAAPDDPARWPAWRAALHRWRADAVRRLGYRADTYDTMPSWAAACRSVCLVWLWDERLYDRVADRFTVAEFLAAGERDYGGFDAVVLWHAYPVIGLDPRNQWDFYRDVPGLRTVVEEFHAAGVRVFVDYNPWDTGTRRAGDDAAELAALVADLGADGVFLDTLKTGDPAIRTALGRSVVLEGESRLPLPAIADHALSWAQWFADSTAPGVLRAHWFERRHLLHHTRRWNRDHSGELQSAWVNGCGMLVWDAVFGVWVGWSDRDRATLRAMRPLQRLFHEHFGHGEWTPLADPHPDAVAAGVFAHRYALGDVTVWPVVNRGVTHTGPVLSTVEGGTWFELAHGAPVEARDGVVSTTVPGRGIACLVRVDGEAPTAITRHRPVPASADTTFPARAVRPVHPPMAAHGTATPGAITVPAGDVRLQVRYRRRETGQFEEAPWVDAWKPLPPELHAVVTETRDVRLGPVAVDATEVTNAEFLRFLRETGYRPRVAHRFLSHWIDGSGDDEPVTYVDLDDARAYARWRGARLPSAAEWQVAMTSGGRRGTPAVWNWTADEYSDGVTRFTVLKGGSEYAAAGSDWYVDGGVQDAAWELKLLRLGAGLDRSPCVGFRCAVDLH